jgi:predicted metal-dependent phosphoesterase TrpH
MSVRGSASHRKGNKTKTIRFKGRLKAAQWAEFKAKLRALVGRHGLKIVVAPARKRKKKK